MRKTLVVLLLGAGPALAAQPQSPAPPRSDLAVSAAGVRGAEIDPSQSTLDPKRIDAMLGASGSSTGGVYKVVIGRTTAMHGHEMGAAMGVNTWAALAGEEPRILFLHYWGVGWVEDLARGLRAALDTTQPSRRAEAQTVVFVCEHGSVKSLIAEEWFNRMAPQRGVAFRAVSRGVTPDDSVPPPIADALRRDGFDVKGFTPSALDASELTTAVRIVAIGVEGRPFPTTVGARVERWDAIPPTSEGYEATRDALKARVQALIDTLELSARQ